MGPGLFTTHITGTVVVAFGVFSKVGPLLAVPVFVDVLGVAIRTDFTLPTFIPHLST
jgi:hypothetical protein